MLKYAARYKHVWGTEVRLHAFLTSVQDERSVSCLGLFIPGERDTSTRCVGDWVGPRAGLDTRTPGYV
jgi:hypothetical protein